ncbi:alginate lyase family protein [Haloferula rosea]|uniref:Alginate lyase family protein n=1 Tax=Haloferula rosea TaxID=490093 RepID=A0A934RB80_9BACT|nr:alginate lyase family protein [Haloferula rosea]MBK1826573.1 alginate lyase family protein [Haloferula rosea]
MNRFAYLVLAWVPLAPCSLAASLPSEVHDTTALVAEVDRNRILQAATVAMEAEPLTITTFRSEVSEGGPNDYYSNGDYWWPDPTKEDGLPYIRRDGETNPQNFDSHRRVLREMRDRVAALAAAYLITGDETYVTQSLDFLDSFFLDPESRMNPHLKYAQAIPGKTPGRGIGIIDTLHLIEVPKAIEVLAGSNRFPPKKLQQLKQWFADYTDWMLTSRNGKEEAETKNNHAVCYWLQVAVFAKFTGNEKHLTECRRRFREDFIAEQMAPDGSFPRELARTKPYGYSLFQLDNMATLCLVLSDEEHKLWTYQDSEGRSMRRAVDFLAPYIADKSTWPHKPDVQSWEGWPTRQSALLFASIAFDEARFLELWKQLKPDPEIEEIQRNVAITQPILWLSK